MPINIPPPKIIALAIIINVLFNKLLISKRLFWLVKLGKLVGKFGLLGIGDFGKR